MIATAHRVRTTEGIDGKDAVGLYLDGIAKTPLLTAEQEVQLAKLIEAGRYAQAILDGTLDESEAPLRGVDATEDELREIAEQGEAAMQRFITANLRLVVSVARKYGRAQMPLLDLVQEGNTGLIRAVEKFDYTKGFKFSTYATWWIRQAISRGMADQSRTIRLPVHLVEQVNKLARIRRELHQQLGREAVELPRLPPCHGQHLGQGLLPAFAHHALLPSSTLPGMIAARHAAAPQCAFENAPSGASPACSSTTAAFPCGPAAPSPRPG